MRSAKNCSITATGNRCRPFCGLYVGRGALTPPRGVGDAAPYSGEPRTFPLWQTPAKRSSLPGLLQPCRGRACPARGLTKAPVCGNTPGGYRIRPYGKSLPPLLRFVCRAANRGVHPANPSFNNNRRPPWKTSPAGGGLLCVNRVYLLILSIAANSSGVNVVCSTALMLSRICCVLEAPIRTVVTSSWCSSQARAISARV